MSFLYKALPNRNKTTNIVFTFIFVLFSIAVNYCGSILAETIVFPLYLDSILTIGVSALCGFFPAIICALGSNLLLSISTNSTFLFSICHVMTAFLSCVVFRFFDVNRSKSKTYSLDCFLWCGLWAAISNGIIGNIIAEFVFAGNTGRPSANIVVQGIYGAIPNLSFANNFGGMLENLADKILSTVISYIIYKVVLYFNGRNSL